MYTNITYFYSHDSSIVKGIILLFATTTIVSIHPGLQLFSTALVVVFQCIYLYIYIYIYTNISTNISRGFHIPNTRVQYRITMPNTIVLGIIIAL